MVDVDFLIFFGQELRGLLHIVLWSCERPLIGGSRKINLSRANGFPSDPVCFLVGVAHHGFPLLSEFFGLLQGVYSFALSLEEIIHHFFCLLPFL